MAMHISRTLIKLNLNELRYRLFKKKSKSFSLAMLPPTEAAAAQHFYRVYYQVQQWFGKSIDPTDRGWIPKEGRKVAVGIRSNGCDSERFFERYKLSM